MGTPSRLTDIFKQPPPPPKFSLAEFPASDRWELILEVLGIAKPYLKYLEMKPLVDAVFYADIERDEFEIKNRALSHGTLVMRIGSALTREWGTEVMMAANRPEHEFAEWTEIFVTRDAALLGLRSRRRYVFETNDGDPPYGRVVKAFVDKRDFLEPGSHDLAAYCTDNPKRTLGIISAFADAANNLVARRRNILAAAERFGHVMWHAVDQLEA